MTIFFAFFAPLREIPCALVVKKAAKSTAE
jgi:hypothetical protein